MNAAIWGLIGTVVGAIASIATTWIASRNNLHIQLITNKQELTERASAFQRQTLVDLQDAIHDTLRLTTQGYIQDRDAHFRGNAWGDNMLEEPLNEEIRLAERRVAILRERVSDDQLRKEIKALMKVAQKTLLSTSAAEAKSLMEECYVVGNNLLESIGTVLRKHY
ncbi:hypothetical protein [Methylophilus sp. Leaf408]|uniref:hypothetical protein n=1 Tax=Methylophilus sp. Leaf408 TaxID=2876561 RepID=UPI001E5FE87E|nr:hypothetical protein [Methylophilus sp. Leaf408]